MASSLRITGLFRYPVKSCAGHTLTEATLDRYGIVGDRRWMVVDPSGRFLTQRQEPRMALISPTIGPDSVALAAPGRDPLTLSLRASGPETRVRVWSDTCRAIDCGDEAAAWLSGFLVRDCRLVRMGEEFHRQTDLDYARPGDEVSFADGFPLLLTGEESLADLNGRLAVAVPMARFRPNVVVDGAGEPFAEDRWRVLRIARSGALLRVVKPCARCQITAIDQQTGQPTGNEPLATLARYRLRNGEVMFGQNLVHQWTGEPFSLRVSDELIVEEAAA